MIRALIASFLLVLAHAGSPAWAHASLVASDPANNAILRDAPSTAVLEFNEVVSTIALRLVHGATAIELPVAAAQNRRIEIALPPGLAAGTYALNWRVISADGHPIGGALVFSVGSPDGLAGTAAADGDARALHVVLWAVRLALYAGLFLGVGGCFFSAQVAGPRPLPLPLRRSLTILTTAGLLAAPLALALQGADVVGGSFAAIADPAVWRTGLMTSYGPTVLVAAAALLAALISLRQGAARRWLPGLALVSVGIALALSGHASVAQPQWLTRPAVFVHAIAVAFWIGALLPLAMSLGFGGAERNAALMFFSRWIPAALAGLVASGAVLAVIQLARIDSLWTTDYGLVFAGKMTVVLLLFGLGALNRFAFTARTLAGSASAARSLRHSIGVEIALAALIFGLVASWRFTPPPRSLLAATEAAAPVLTMFTDAEWMVHLTVEPARVGPVTISAEIMGMGGNAAAPKGVTLELRNEGAGIEPIERVLDPLSPAVWSARLLMPASGQWSVEVKLLVSDFAETSLAGTVDIRP